MSSFYTHRFVEDESGAEKGPDEIPKRRSLSIYLFLLQCLLYFQNTLLLGLRVLVHMPYLSILSLGNGEQSLCMNLTGVSLIEQYYHKYL